MDERINKILDYWFDALEDGVVIDKRSLTVRRWFSGGKRVDEEIRQAFEDDLLKAAQGTYKDWEASITGRLAMVILFDQFSRNIYRDTLKAFAYDPLAMALSLRSVEDETHHELSFIRRLFLYMPLMHAEDLKTQRRSVQCFTELVEETKIKDPVNTSYYASTLSFAQRHLAIIEQFGRFPHRNAALNRTSTPEELSFLNKPGSSF